MKILNTPRDSVAIYSRSRLKFDEVEKWLDECEKELNSNSKMTDMQTLVN